MQNIRDMVGRTGLCSRKAAQEAFMKGLAAPKLNQVEIDAVSSLGRITGCEIRSPVDLPEFARSTMDGYAVRARDTFGASESLQAYLNLVGEVPMGLPAGMEVGAQEAAKIATGGMLPRGADAVVMFEHTSVVDAKMIEVSRPVAPGENLIQAGEDLRKGRAIIGPGQMIRPQDIGVLCGAGITTIHVYERPRVAVIPTGNEIVPPDRRPTPGQVRDINSYHLCALLEKAGCTAVRFDIVRDEEEPLKKAVLQGIEQTDLVLLSGGSSVGTRDLTAKVVGGLGSPGVMIHGVAVKPGKPTLCARVGDKAVIGLPGHPAAVAIAFDLFVKPVVRVLSGETVPSWERLVGRRVRARLTRNINSRAGREDYVRVALSLEAGTLSAKPVLGKSGLISTLVDAHGTVIVPEQRLGFEKGEEVDVHVFENFLVS